MGFEVIDVLADRLGTTVEEKSLRDVTEEESSADRRCCFKAPDLYEPEGGRRKGMRLISIKWTRNILLLYMMISAWMWGSCGNPEKGSAGAITGLKASFPPGEPRVPAHKVGVGDKPKKMDLADYVLSRFSKRTGLSWRMRSGSCRGSGDDDYSGALTRQ